LHGVVLVARATAGRLLAPGFFLHAKPHVEAPGSKFKGRIPQST